MGRRGTEKHPVRLTNKFVAKLTGEEMWWDDDLRLLGSASDRIGVGANRSSSITASMGGSVAIQSAPSLVGPPKLRVSKRRSYARRSIKVSTPPATSARAGRRLPFKTWSIATSKTTCRRKL